MDEQVTNHKPHNGADATLAFQSALEVRSEEVQEIIGRPPHGLIRWGITVFLGVLMLVLLCAWFVKYPETINAPFRLVAINAPKTLASKIDGKLVRLCFVNNSYVHSGQVLAWMQSTASHRQVLRLSALVDSMRSWLDRDEFDKFKTVILSGFTDLGELQSAFQTFGQTWRDYQSFLPGGFYDRKRSILEHETADNRLLLEKLKEQHTIQQENYKLAQQQYDTQKKLADKKMVAPLELAKQKSSLLSSRLPLQQTESAIINNHVTQTAKQKEQLELNQKIAQEQSIFLQALNTLGSSIKEWENKYLIMAPLPGKLIYAGVLQQNQTLRAGQDVFYIQPDNTRFFGELAISQHSFGKIREGQHVLVRFNGYPYQEFGSVSAKITYLSAIPVQDSVFLAKISFPGGLSTNYNRNLTPRNGMTGQAEIITQDMRLLQRFYNNMTKQLR